MKEDLQLGQQPACGGTQCQRRNDLQQGVEQNGDQIQLAADQRFGNAEADRKHDQAHCVIQCDDGQKKIGHRTLCFILAYYHQRGGRRSSRRNGAQGNRLSRRQLFRQQHVDRQQCGIHQQSGGQGLNNADDGSLVTRGLQVLQTELISDGKGDEAQRHLRDQMQTAYRFSRDQAQTGNMHTPQNIGTDQYTGHQIRSYVRQSPQVEYTCHQKSRQSRDGNR